MSETVVLSDEQFVREHWKALGNLWWDREYDEKWISASDEQGKPIRLFRGRSTDVEAWRQARTYTEDRLEQIRQIEEEMDEAEHNWSTAWLRVTNIFAVQAETADYAFWWTRCLCRSSRLLARLRAIHDDLKRGMR